MDKVAVQPKQNCWICFNDENKILKTLNSEKLSSICMTYLEHLSFTICVQNDTQVTCCIHCYESAEILTLLDEQIKHLQKEISNVSLSFSKNILDRRSVFKNKNNRTAKKPTPPAQETLTIDKTSNPSHSTILIENQTEVFEIGSKDLSSDSQTNIDKVDLFNDPWFAVDENEMVAKDDCEILIDSENNIDVKHSYDETVSKIFEKEIALKPKMSTAEAIDEEAAKTTSTKDLLKCLKMPILQLKRLQLGVTNDSTKIVAVAFEETMNCKKPLCDSNERDYSSTISSQVSSECNSKTFNRTQTKKGRKIVKHSTNSSLTKSFPVDCGKMIHDRIQSNETTVNRCNIAKALTTEVSGKQEKIQTAEGQPKSSICNKSFLKPGLLKIHERVHTKERLFNRSLCAKSFGRADNLKQHRKTVHSEEKPYTCSVCNKSFRKLIDLNRHKKIHLEERPFDCSFCEKSFKIIYHLKAHEKIRSGVKPYKCSFCSKSFYKSSDISRHERMHTGEKPYNCPICAKNFSQKNHLKIHRERVHGKSI